MSSRNPAFFEVGKFVDESPISDIDFRYRVPPFDCPECGAESRPAYHFSYPHLDPAEILSKEELKLIDGRRPMKASHATLLECTKRMENYWGVPVTAGAHFGPVRVKISAKPKVDFDVLLITSNFFARRRAAELLAQDGFDFDFIKADAYGKHADAADFVQLIVPIAAHCSLPDYMAFCSRCNRWRRTGTPTNEPFVLFDSPVIHELPFFFTLETTILCLSSSFVEAVKRHGLTGFIEGKTLFPISVVPDPVSSRPPMRWIRIKTTKSQTTASQKNVDASQPQPILDSAFAKSWLSRLSVFLEKVNSRNGKAQLDVRIVTGNGLTLPLKTPHPLRVLLEACGGKLSFSYSIEIDGQKFSGYLDLDAKSLKKHKADCKQWAEDTWVAEEAEEKEIWLKAIPFAALKNGDYLALDTRSSSDNPPVVYLNHEDASEVLSPSLGHFLQEWEKVRYVGPENWVLAEYLDSDGHLSRETNAARELDSLLGQ